MAKSHRLLNLTSLSVELGLTCSMIAILTITIHSQIPRTIAWQGILTDSKGNVRPDSQYTVTFGLYDAESGGSRQKKIKSSTL